MLSDAMEEERIKEKVISAIMRDVKRRFQSRSVTLGEEYLNEE